LSFFPVFVLLLACFIASSLDTTSAFVLRCLFPLGTSLGGEGEEGGEAVREERTERGDAVLEEGERILVDPPEEEREEEEDLTIGVCVLVLCFKGRRQKK